MTRLRLGFIGAGWWAVEHQMPYFASRDDVELVAVCRLGQDELAWVRDKFGFAFATQDYRELVKQKLDAVVVASPHVNHYEHAKAALEAGLHALVEKPMTTRARDARELSALAEQNHLHLLIPQGWNFTPYVCEASRLVRAGEIGDVRHVVCQMASALHDLLGGQPMSETQGQRFRPPASTWADPDRAGGYGWGQLAHALGVLFGIADLRATEVFAWMGVSPSGADYYDAIVVRFANDATGVISGSATIPKPAGARHDRSKGYQIDLRMFGSQGMLLLDVERERLEIRRNDGRDTVLPLHKGDGDYPAAAPWAHFIDLVLGRTTENPMPGDTGVKTVEVLEAAYRSAVGGGRIVYISEL